MICFVGSLYLTTLPISSPNCGSLSLSPRFSLPCVSSVSCPCHSLLRFTKLFWPCRVLLLYHVFDSRVVSVVCFPAQVCQLEIGSSHTRCKPRFSCSRVSNSPASLAVNSLSQRCSLSSRQPDSSSKVSAINSKVLVSSKVLARARAILVMVTNRKLR